MRNLLSTVYILIFSLLIFSACQSLPYSKANAKLQLDIKNYELKSIFYQDTSGHVYDVRIYIQKKEFSGLLFFKQINNMYRFSILTKTGQKLVDMSVSESDMIVHHVMSELDRKLILDQLKRDLQLLILHCHVSENTEVVKSQSLNKTFIRLPSCLDDAPDFTHFIFDEHGQLAQIGVGKKRRMKSWAIFQNYHNDFPQHITIDHRTLINLRLELFNLEFDKE